MNVLIMCSEVLATTRPQRVVFASSVRHSGCQRAEVMKAGGVWI